MALINLIWKRYLSSSTKLLGKEVPKESADVFGIDEELSSQSQDIVQGNYKRIEKDENEEKDPELTERLAKYDYWIRQSETSKANQNGQEGPIPEKTRATKVGTIRLDSDNVVTEDGQFETYANIPKLKNATKLQEDSDTTSTEMFDAPRRTAFEYLKSQKNKRVSDDPKTIARPAVGRSSRKSKYNEEAPSNEKDALAMDSNVVPKIYKIQNYNLLTEADMWNILRKSILFENEFLLAIDKPFGVPMHSPAIDCRHFVTKFLPEFAKYCSTPEIFPLHRIDRETSGALIFAKNSQVASYLKQKFANREIIKTYLAITKNCPINPKGVIKIPIGEGKVGATGKYRSKLKPDLKSFGLNSLNTTPKNAYYAETHYKVLSSTQNSAFVEINPVTGLKHQIRVHMALGLGCPILADHKYSHRDKLAPQRLTSDLLHLLKVKQSKVRELPMHLHCYEMSFSLSKELSPSSERILIHSNIPRYFLHTLRALKLR